MSDVQRWTVSQSLHCDREHDGVWVRYADHVAAVEFIKKHDGCADAEREEGYDAGFADALGKARDAVAAISTPDDLTRSEALAAIDALRTPDE